VLSSRSIGNEDLSAWAEAGHRATRCVLRTIARRACAPRGPSGSGKTTLLNLVAALDCPDCGEIIVGGADVTGLSRSSAALYRNERVGFIFNPTTCSRSSQRSRIFLCRCSRSGGRIQGTA